MKKIGIVGLGYLGSAYSKVFEDAVLFDEPKGIGTKEEINTCDIALVAVPTDPLPDGTLDMSIVEGIVDWLETPLILIKSALMPGTVDRLIKKTGKKIAVSVEYIGMGKYYTDPSQYPDPLDPQKHKLLVIGGETKVADECAGVLWAKMSPATRIHIVTAKEAETCKLIENFYGALKVTFANCFSIFVKNQTLVSLVLIKHGVKMEGQINAPRVVKGKRGWKSHCYDKDIQALQSYSKLLGVSDMAHLAKTIVDLNKEHIKLND